MRMEMQRTKSTLLHITIYSDIVHVFPISLI
uniref:Uncharacterized protein n=1 Tax=Anguilla anguilla TaxID=7936 RepID=A0A0E9UKV8_ANGAN